MQGPAILFLSTSKQSADFCVKNHLSHIRYASADHRYSSPLLSVLTPCLIILSTTRNVTHIDKCCLQRFTEAAAQTAIRGFKAGAPLKKRTAGSPAVASSSVQVMDVTAPEPKSKGKGKAKACAPFLLPYKLYMPASYLAVNMHYMLVMNICHCQPALVFSWNIDICPDSNA